MKAKKTKKQPLPYQELREIMMRIAAECYDKGEATKKRLVEIIRDNYRELAWQVTPFLADQALEKLALSCMKRIHSEDRAKMISDLKIEHIPYVISYRTKDEVYYTTIDKATLPQLDDHIAYLKERIENISMPLMAEEEFRQKLLPIFESHPNITCYEAWQIYKLNQTDDVDNADTSDAKRVKKHAHTASGKEGVA